MIDYVVKNNDTERIKAYSMLNEAHNILAKLNASSNQKKMIEWIKDNK